MPSEAGKTDSWRGHFIDYLKGDVKLNCGADG